MPEMEPIPDIKDIIAPPEVIDPNINFFLIIGIIIGSIILLAYIFLYWLKIKTTLSPEELTDQRKKALDQLHKLKLDHTKISTKEVANIIISSIRPVIQSKFGNLSLSLTTEEFLIQFNITDLISKEQHFVVELVHICTLSHLELNYFFLQNFLIVNLPLKMELPLLG